MKATVVTFTLQVASSALLLLLEAEVYCPPPKRNKQTPSQPQTKKKPLKNIGPINKAWAHRSRNIWVHSHNTRGVRALVCLTKLEKKVSQGKKKN